MISTNEILDTINTDTINRKKNRNVFASIHSAPGTFYPDLWEGKNKKFDKKDLVKSFTAYIPQNTIVFTFTPTNNYAWSTFCQEKDEIMVNLRHPGWMWFHDWPLQRHAKIYLPGQPMYNQICEFDTGESKYFDIYTLYGNPISAKKIKQDLGRHKKASAFKKSKTSSVTRRTPRMTSRSNYNKFSYTDVIINNKFTIQELLNEFESDPPKDGSKPYRIIYIYSCNPHVESKDVRQITKKKSEQNEIITMNYHIRKTYEKEGRDRFMKMFLGGIDQRNTRGMLQADKVYFDKEKEEQERLRTYKQIGVLEKHMANYETQLENGITESGSICTTKCKGGMCTRFGCGKTTCMNEYGEVENCYYPTDKRKARKSRKKKKRKKKKKRNKTSKK